MKKKNYKDYDNIKCPFCNTNITDRIFKIKNVYWRDSLKHLIKEHNHVPDDRFINIIFEFKLPLKINSIIKLDNSHILKKKNLVFVKIKRNQLMIMDALMEHGGIKQYKNMNKFLYSEHSGLLDFEKYSLNNIIVFANTDNVDKFDDEIFLPNNNPDAFDYEYLFHTHPPTPFPGGRAEHGYLYEFPSINDILHFIEHYNTGVTQGSIVIAPEGMYNIRKKEFDGKTIKINYDNLFKYGSKKFYDVNKEAIKIYGTKYSKDKFYSKIAQDKKYIKMFNDFLAEYEIHIDYYPRIQDNHNENIWYLDTVFLPVYPVSKITDY